MFTTVLRLAGRGLASAAVLTATLAVVVVLVLPRLTGGAVLTVLSGSMTPTIPVGSLVLVEPTAPETIRTGDVITFQTAPGVAEYVTHRVVRVQHNTTPKTFVTKGDANKGEDLEPVPFGAVRGKVRYHLPHAGTAAQLVKTPVGVLAVGGAFALYVLSLLLRTVLTEIRKGSAPRGDAPSPLDVPASVK